MATKSGLGLAQTTVEHPMRIKTSIHWLNGKTTSRVINYNNEDHRAQFAAMAVEAWKKGASVTTQPVEESKESKESKESQ